MRYALIGSGRMGSAVDAAATARGHERVATVRAPTDRAALAGAEVAFEFTRPDAARDNVASLIDAGVAVVCGTTGWTPDDELLERARRADAGVMIAPNFAIGVALFFRLADRTARLLGAAGMHQAYVLEAHHRGKRDAPSGTARRLAEIVRDADPRIDAIHDGPLPDGPLPDDRLQVVSVRAGGEPGTHRLGYDGAHDRIVLEHVSRSRSSFAEGAVRAAEWLVGRGGLHTLDEMIDAMLAEAGEGGTST